MLYGKILFLFLNSKAVIMASINTNQGETRMRRGFAKRNSSLSLRIDMTPMVDLGFLLITFFIFTSTMNEPNTMNLFMPKSEGSETLIPDSGAFTIIIDKDNKLFYYEGNSANPDIASASLMDLRKALINKKKEVIANYKPDAACEAKALANHLPLSDCYQKKLNVLIKPTPGADYKTIVAVLDEMTINKIARYVLADPDENELALLNKK